MTDLDAALNATPRRAQHPAEQLGAGKADLDGDTLTVTGAVVDQSVEARGNFDHVLALFNLDPAEFDVVDETVRMSTWQQSKRTDDGERDVVQLYAYSFRARRRSADAIRPEVVDAWREALTVTDRPALIIPRPPVAGSTYVVLVADPQLGKKGTAEAVENWKRGVAAHMDEVRAAYPRVERIHVAFMGDEHENVTGNYVNQSHTVELNRSRQLELDYDMRVWTMRQALALGLPVTASSVVSNHGEWTRFGDSKQPVTTANDNSSTHIARQVKKLFDERATFGEPVIEWTIGDTHPGVVLDLSGVKGYFSHGYIEKGRGPSVEVRTKQAIERQILGRTDDLGDVRLYFMAHYHHLYTNEFEGRTLFGCPAIEAEKSSEYMLDQYGVWSPPGVLGLLVGEHASRRGWAAVNVH